MAAARAHAASSHNVKLSKSLSYVLRHAAVKEGIAMRPDGFVRIADLLAHPRFHGVTVADIHAVVMDNDKQRFRLAAAAPTTGEPAPDDTPADVLALLDASWWIRANQGHSLSVVSQLALVALTPDTLPAVIVHGTYLRHYASILQHGLRPMSRHHVHMAEQVPDSVDGAGGGQVISGMRSDCDLLVYIDGSRAVAMGAEFYRSDNAVILSAGVPSDGAADAGSSDGKGTLPLACFQRVVERRGEHRVLVENGRITEVGEQLRSVSASLAQQHRANRGQGRGRGRGRQR